MNDKVNVDKWSTSKEEEKQQKPEIYTKNTWTMQTKHPKKISMLRLQLPSSQAK
jgi:hypothetical protein